MRTILILGGTGWLGREIATQLVANGDSVSCLARGDSGVVPPGASIIRVDRNIEGAYDAVASERWDEVIELSYDPAFVQNALSALAGRAEHWTLISTVSVYASNDTPGADESAELLDPTDLNEYGRAKVAAERASAAALGERLLIIRPGLIGGPGDPSDRFGYWVARLAFVGHEPVLVPASSALPVQVIDVRDLAAFTRDASIASLIGTVNAVGDEHTFAEVIGRASAIAGYTGDLVEAPDSWLIEQGVGYWSGIRSLPLWLPGKDAAHGQRSNAAYTRAGGMLRAIDETLADTLDDERVKGLERNRRSGLSRQEELLLIEQYRSIMHA